LNVPGIVHSLCTPHLTPKIGNGKRKNWEGKPGLFGKCIDESKQVKRSEDLTEFEVPGKTPQNSQKGRQVVSKKRN